MKPLPNLLHLGRIFLSVVLAVTAGAATSHAASAANAAWLAESYVTDPGHVRLVPELGTKMKAQRVQYLFVKTATLDAQGRSEAKPAQLAAFLNALGQWETANKHRFTVLLCLQGSLAEDSPRQIDLSVSAVRNALTAESLRYLRTTSDGYLANARRPADGLLLDLESNTWDDPRFRNLGTILQHIRESLEPNQKLGFAAQKIQATGASPKEGQFSYIYYHYVARNVDYIVAKTYDSGARTKEEYLAWIEEQTRNTLRAVSGAFWKFDENHAEPTNGVKVFVGFPAYPSAPPLHREGVECVPQAAAGVMSALSSLDATSRGCFEGAALYLHNDGVSPDGHARWDKEWREFREFWLGL